MLVGPVVYLWESAGESIILVLVFGLCVSPEMDSGVVVWLSVLSVMMLLISLFLSSDLALGRGVLVRGWLGWVCVVVLLWIGLILDDWWLFPGEKLASGGVDPLLMGLNEDSLVLCSISERILSRSLLWCVSECQ